MCISYCIHSYQPQTRVLTTPALAVTATVTAVHASLPRLAHVWLSAPTSNTTRLIVVYSLGKLLGKYY